MKNKQHFRHGPVEGKRNESRVLNSSISQKPPPMSRHAIMRLHSSATACNYTREVRRPAFSTYIRTSAFRTNCKCDYINLNLTCIRFWSGYSPTYADINFSRRYRAHSVKYDKSNSYNLLDTLPCMIKSIKFLSFNKNQLKLIFFFFCLTCSLTKLAFKDRNLTKLFTEKLFYNDKKLRMLFTQLRMIEDYEIFRR